MVPYAELHVDAGFASKDEAESAGVRISTPVTYLPPALDLADGRIAGTAVDDRAGCAALLALAAARKGKAGPPLHLVWSVQEEHNLQGVLPAVTALAPDIALAVDMLPACDTPEVAARGDIALGGGSGRSTIHLQASHRPCILPDRQAICASDALHGRTRCSRESTTG